MTASSVPGARGLNLRSTSRNTTTAAPTASVMGLISRSRPTSSDTLSAVVCSVSGTPVIVPSCDPIMISATPAM